ncbi:unnamed protein product [Allacma fusca]|nr:unnamed protein product [Allacma fusca]
MATQASKVKTTTPRTGGLRNWLKDQVGITTTTTVKPNLVNRAHSYYRETKDKAKQLLDPRTLAAKTVSKAIQGG